MPRCSRCRSWTKLHVENQSILKLERVLREQPGAHFHIGLVVERGLVGVWIVEKNPAGLVVYVDVRSVTKREQGDDLLLGKIGLTAQLELRLLRGAEDLHFDLVTFVSGVGENVQLRVRRGFSAKNDARIAHAKLNVAEEKKGVSSERDASVESRLLRSRLAL